MYKMGCLIPKKEAEVPEVPKPDPDTNKDRLFTVREASADLEMTSQPRLTQKSAPRTIS